MMNTVTSGSGNSDCVAGTTKVSAKTIKAIQAFHFTPQKYTLAVPQRTEYFRNQEILHFFRPNPTEIVKNLRH